MKHKKTSILFLLFLAVSFALTGCGQNFDASRYVQACLDANTHGEFNDYAEITKISVEDARKQYDNLLDQEIAAFDEYNLSNEKKEKFRTLFEKMYKSFKYEVGEATKKKDGSYSVPVTTYKMLAFQNLAEDMTTFIMDYYQDAIAAGKSPSENEAFEVATDFMYDYITKNIDNPEYEEAVTTTVTVAKTDNNSNIYTLTNDELNNLLNTMFDFENIR